MANRCNERAKSYVTYCCTPSREKTAKPEVRTIPAAPCQGTHGPAITSKLTRFKPSIALTPSVSLLSGSFFTPDPLSNVINRIAVVAQQRTLHQHVVSAPCRFIGTRFALVENTIFPKFPSLAVIRQHDV